MTIDDFIEEVQAEAEVPCDCEECHEDTNLYYDVRIKTTVRYLHEVAGALQQECDRVLDGNEIVGMGTPLVTAAIGGYHAEVHVLILAPL